MPWNIDTSSGWHSFFREQLFVQQCSNLRTPCIGFIVMKLIVSGDLVWLRNWWTKLLKPWLKPSMPSLFHDCFTKCWFYTTLVFTNLFYTAQVFQNLYNEPSMFAYMLILYHTSLPKLIIWPRYVSLHVRKSNRAALNLYTQALRFQWVFLRRKS